MDRDRDQRGERGLLVDRRQDAREAGLARQRPAIVNPRPTEIVTSARAMIPEARLASHQACWARLVFTPSPPADPRARVGP